MTTSSISLSSFKVRLKELIESHSFGEPARPGEKHDEASLSPAAKELRKTNLIAAVEGDTFSKTILNLSKECQGLDVDRRALLEAASRMRPVISRYNTATKRLKNCQVKLEGFLTKYDGLIAHRLDYKVRSAIDLVREVADELQQRKQLLISNLHPKLRRTIRDVSEWELLFHLYRYDPAQLGTKALDQNFWRGVDNALTELIANRRIAKISAMTRYKLIAAISDAAGQVTVSPAAIKQFFFEHSSRPAIRKTK